MYFRYKCGHVYPAPFWKDDCVYSMPGKCRDCRKKMIIEFAIIRKGGKVLHIRRKGGGNEPRPK